MPLLRENPRQADGLAKARQDTLADEALPLRILVSFFYHLICLIKFLKHWYSSEYRSGKRGNVNLHMKKVHGMGGYDNLVVDGEFDWSHLGMTAEDLKVEKYFLD